MWRTGARPARQTGPRGKRRRVGKAIVRWRSGLGRVGSLPLVRAQVQGGATSRKRADFALAPWPQVLSFERLEVGAHHVGDPIALGRPPQIVHVETAGG